MERERPKTIPSNNAVRITYYIESPANTIQSNRKIKLQPFSWKSQTGRRCGYDRKAELLSYTNQLRNADSNSSSSSSHPKKERWKWSTTPARLRVLFFGICQRMNGGRWKYEQMLSGKKTNSNRRKKNKSSRKSTLRFCKKFMCMLRGLSLGGKNA